MQVNKLDWIVFNAALFGVMFAGVEIGLAIAIGTSIVLAILKVAFPRTSLLGHLPGTNVLQVAVFFNNLSLSQGPGCSNLRSHCARSPHFV